MIDGTGSGSDLEPRATRRRLVGALAVAGTGLALRTVSASAQEDDEATPEAASDEPIAEATAPNWSVLLMQFQDPYPTEQIQVPENPPGGIRFVAIEVAIDNSADQPLNFTPGDMRLIDANGTEYRGGQSAGPEPFFSPRNLDRGDRSRGWVWFMVPEDAIIAELAYEAPRPLFKIAVDDLGG